MKITVLGAGGMGSRFALMLHQAGNAVTLVDGWDKNIQAIRENGLQASFNGKQVTAHLPIFSPQAIDQSGEKAELIIVFTKSQQLEAMFKQVKPIIGPDTYVLCLLNGIGHEDVLEKFVAKDHLLLGITMWTASMQGPGQVTLTGSGNVELQNFEPAGKAFAQQVVALFDKAGLNPTYSENVKYSIWRKACVNGTLNSLCALLACNIKQLGETDQAESLLKTIIAEFAAVGAKEGLKLDQSEIYQHVASTFTSSIADHYPSMYQDLVMNNRKTEIDYINGTVWRKGQKYGVPTPTCALITQLIHAKETVEGAK